MNILKVTLLSTLLLPSIAVAGDFDKLLGAAAGAAVGSTIGKDDGRTIAMAAGAVIGAKLAEDNSHNRDHYVAKSDRDFYRICERRVPREYSRNRGAKRAWTEGCVNRMLERQAELEREAYEDGISGYRKEHYHRDHH